MTNQGDALQELCTWIMPELEDDVPSGQDILDFAVSRLTDIKKLEALTLIEEILRKNPSGAELERLWFGNGARIGVVNNSFYRTLFGELKNRLQGAPAAFQF